MLRPLTLLLTHDATVIEHIRMIHDESETARLEVCGRTEKALSCLADTTRLLLIDSRTDESGLRLLLTASKRLGTPTMMLAHSGTPAVGPGMGGQVNPTCSLPNDLPTLRELIHDATAREAEVVEEPTIDPMTAALLGSELDEYLTLIRRVAAQNTTILLTGETGCGKSMLGRLIHAASPRRAEPYMVVDCGALSEHLIESEIFGHVRGAFTGAERDRPGKFTAAGNGTLVLDEINSLPLPLQAKLLRAVEDRLFEPVGSNRSEKLRARLIAVSNVPLEDEVRRERFRSDLYYRLNVVELRLPPLRERRDAVVPLAHKFLRETASNPHATGLSSTALAAMVEYAWPGNVRELRNVIERAVALTAGSVIQLSDLPLHIRERGCPSHTRPALIERAVASVLDQEAAIEDGFVGDECALLLALLTKHRNNRRRTAEELGVSRMTLYKKLHKHGIFVPKSKSGILRSTSREIVDNSLKT